MGSKNGFLAISEINLYSNFSKDSILLLHIPAKRRCQFNIRYRSNDESLITLHVNRIGGFR